MLASHDVCDDQLVIARHRSHAKESGANERCSHLMMCVMKNCHRSSQGGYACFAEWGVSTGEVNGPLGIHISRGNNFRVSYPVRMASRKRK